MAKLHIKKFVILLTIPLLVSCGITKDKTADYAQCQIDSYSETGLNFEKSFSPLKKGDNDAAYRNWLILCMQSKGYQFYGPEETRCWNGMTSNAMEKSCYH